MVIFMYFVGIDDGVHDTIDWNSEGEKDGRSSVYDDPGKSVFILIGYKIAHNVYRYHKFIFVC